MFIGFPSEANLFLLFFEAPVKWPSTRGFSFEELLALHPAPAAWALEELKGRISELLPVGSYWPEVEEAILVRHFEAKEVLALLAEPSKAKELVLQHGGFVAKRMVLEELHKDWPRWQRKLQVEWHDVEAFLLDLKAFRLRFATFFEAFRRYLKLFRYVLPYLSGGCQGSELR